VWIAVRLITRRPPVWLSGLITSLLVIRRWDGMGRSTREDAYTFRHALVHEAIYAELLPGKRTRLHTALAHTLTDRLHAGERDWLASAAEVAVHWPRAPLALAVWDQAGLRRRIFDTRFTPVRCGVRLLRVLIRLHQCRSSSVSAALASPRNAATTAWWRSGSAAMLRSSCGSRGH
jgi:hypothetical protein